MNKKEYLKNLKLLTKAYAKEDFFFYCKNKAPDFYKSDRQYLVKLCDEMQNFFESDDEVLIINAPPRHGKSRTAGCFCEWVLGNYPDSKIMVGSYNEILSSGFSKNVRNTINESGGSLSRTTFADIFPNVKIAKGDGAAQRWTVENGYNSFLATSPMGTATGFGATLLVIDDLIKSAYEANNNASLEAHWRWFTDTMLSRLEEGGKILIIMTRWHTKDLAGRALKHFTAHGAKLKHVSYKAVNDDGSMLCPEILSLRSYKNKIRAMGRETAEANYQQTPIDVKGRLYRVFKTYQDLPEEYSGRYNYTDTADTGADFLCSVNYIISGGEAYIINVLYTKENMEITESLTAEMLYRDKIGTTYIEANNGGRGFARSVERILKEKYGSNYTKITVFNQTKNKVSRILSNSTWVMEHIYFPQNWAYKYPEFYSALCDYSKEGRNAHDDAPDCITGIAERMNGGDLFSFD